ncbi:MAG: potassium channel family protein [Cytophagales bacterium]|jgi:hypothetical protein|nr:potassium channel family protein [Cytophagales bacterium]
MKDDTSRSDIYLTVTLVGILLLNPVFAYYNASGYFFGAYLLVLLVSTYRDSHTSRATRLPELVTGVVALVCAWLHVVYPEKHGIQNINLVAFSIFLLIHTLVLLNRVVYAKQVNRATVLSCVNVYIFIGFLGACVACLIELDMPGSYNIATKNQTPEFYQFLYYSFVTLGTLGYGDVLPQNAFSQSLAIVLILVGQFYMAIIMALIIGKYLNGKGT